MRERDYGMQETEDGIVIWHEGDKPRVVTARYDKERHTLTLLIDETAVRLTFGESGYFLAHMATWYDLGGD